MKTQVYLYSLCGTLLYPCSLKLDFETETCSLKLKILPKVKILSLLPQILLLFSFPWVRVLSGKRVWAGIHHTVQIASSFQWLSYACIQRPGIMGWYHPTCLAIASSIWIDFANRIQKQWCCAFLSLELRGFAHFKSINLLALYDSYLRHSV